MSELLFFIAVMPDEEIQRAVTDFKHYCAEHFEAKHALKSPPHLTLFPPFKWQLNRLDELVNTLEYFAKQKISFTLLLKNFNAFAPRVIFVDVEKSEALQELQQRLESYLNEKLHLKNDRAHPELNPHITIAHKDLKRDLFAKAWAYFAAQTYERSFVVTHIVLLQHTGGRWEPYRAFPIG